MAISVSGTIGNGAGNILTAFKPCFGQMSHFGDYGLVQMDQSPLEAIPTGANSIDSCVRCHLNHVGQVVSYLVEVSGPNISMTGASGIDIAARLLVL
ncbi:hypothetical protein AMTR_s00128p00091870 [Amborella trichopoda]|uniref:Uncharacterized protein n=1 Tax=Amborella trichopoda TaxID=13333 RepID=W1NPY5_AMBTC|nr:hypothetical protein AMTR_s00128p00091870 [Amborella trichopoda]